MSTLRRSSRIAAKTAAEAIAVEQLPLAARSGRVSKAPVRFTETVFKELPMANNKYTKGRRIAPGFSIEREPLHSKYGTADRDTMVFIKDSVDTLKTATADEAVDVLEDIMDDLHAIMESAPENEDLNDALCLFYNAYENAEDLAESDPGRIVRKVYKEAFEGYKLLAENVLVHDDSI